MLPSADSRLACLVILLLISTASPVSVLLWIVLRSFFPPASTETEREREIVCQSGYQDVSGSVMKDTFLHIAQHTAQMWQLMCCWSRRCPLHMMQGDLTWRVTQVHWTRIRHDMTKLLNLCQHPLSWTIHNRHKEKMHVKCNNHNFDFRTGNVCNVFNVKILSLSV